MRREEAIRILTERRDDLVSRFGLRSMALFGSVARDEATDESDVDIVVSFEQPATLRAYFELKDQLESALHCTVDLVTEKGLKPRARTMMEREMVHVG